MRQVVDLLCAGFDVEEDNMDEFSWFVGLFEGEGSFAIERGIARGLSIEMTDRDVLERVASGFGGQIYATSRHETHPGWKPSWKWMLFGDPAAELAERMAPHLGERRTERCLEFLKSRKSLIERRERAEGLRQRIRELRAEGHSLRVIGARLGIDHGYVGRVIRQTVSS